jgi:hypothetical protein
MIGSPGYCLGAMQTGPDGTFLANTFCNARYSHKNPRPKSEDSKQGSNTRFPLGIHDGLPLGFPKRAQHSKSGSKAMFVNVFDILFRSAVLHNHRVLIGHFQCLLQFCMELAKKTPVDPLDGNTKDMTHGIDFQFRKPTRRHHIIARDPKPIAKNGCLVSLL